MADNLDIQTLWKQVNEAIRRGPINRPLWDACTAAVPIALDEDVLILGFEPRDMRHSSYLETTTNKNRIQEIIQARTGKRIDIKCIEGATLAAWESTKAREAEQQEKIRAGFEQMRAHGTSVGAWEGLGQRLTNLFATTESRRLALVQAMMLVRSLPLIYETDLEVRAKDPEAESIHNRELNRSLEKVATFCDLPPTQVALEYMRYKSSRKTPA